jgi:L-malate glycosyltransferase
MAAALTSEKGHEVLIRSCSLLKSKNINFQFDIAGDGPLENEYKNLVMHLGLDKNIKFLGHISNVTQFLSSLDILVVPSTLEGLGTILLDGAFARCVLVGTRVGGIPEIIIHGRTGLSVEVGDSDALALELEKLIASEQLRSTLTQNAFEYVKKEFSLENMVSGNLKVYKELFCI